jgi:hypothetical protein
VSNLAQKNWVFVLDVVLGLLVPELGSDLLFIHFGQFFFHGGVPMILDGVIGASVEVLGDLSPAVAESFVR